MFSQQVFRRIIFAIAALAGALPAAAQVATSGPYWPGPAVSGSWYDPARSGEGLIVQYLPDGRALVVWFTYPPAGAAGEQAWLITDLGNVEGRKLKFNTVYQPQGGVFGEAFNPTAITNTVWGTLELEFRDCNTATLRYTGPAAFGSGTRNLTRLTALDQLECNGTKALTTTGARALSGLRAGSGAWFVPSRSGEGWMIEELPDGRSVVYWFTYDPQGRQAWTIGSGTRDGNRIDIAGNLLTRGTNFGAGFNAANVQQVPWGTLSFTFSNCGNVDVRYASSVAGYGRGTRSGVRLAALASTACIDGTPEPRINGAWSEAAAMPLPAQSEHAATVLDGKIYALGGFGDPQGFKRYDPGTNTWTVLTPMLAGRDHLAAFASDGGVYFVGGSSHASSGDTIAAYRYDVAADRWDPRPELLFNFGSHAAVLNGRAYIGNANGTLQEYDPVQRSSRVIARATPDRNRDHSQVVAFLGEIWMIAGRAPETTTVAIYDPVTERWRNGPSINRARGGFAAAVVDDQIVIGGGEVLGTTFRVEPTTEVLTAGSDVWRMGPNLPLAVHGVAGAGLSGRFYVVSGSTIAGTADGNTGRLHSIQLMP